MFNKYGRVRGSRLPLTQSVVLNCGGALSRKGPARGERLSWLSSGLPWPIVSDDGIEDCQQLSGDCDECDHLWFAGSDKTLVERLQDWIVPRGNRRAHEQRGSHDGTTAANEAFAAPFAGLASKGSEASKRRNLPAAELPELG